MEVGIGRETLLEQVQPAQGTAPEPERQDPLCRLAYARQIGTPQHALSRNQRFARPVPLERPTTLSSASRAALAATTCIPPPLNRNRTQYFEMFGDRVLYLDGWIASTKDPAVLGAARFAPGARTPPPAFAPPPAHRDRNELCVGRTAPGTLAEPHRAVRAARAPGRTNGPSRAPRGPWLRSVLDPMRAAGPVLVDIGPLRRAG
jgi:hypothetical protein